MPSIMWGEDVAAVYDVTSAEMFEPAVLDPVVDRLAELAGDMTTTHLDGAFTLVYVVWNSITKVTTQQEQVAVFANAAAHLEPGGVFEKVAPSSSPR